MAYWMLMSPTTFSALATLNVQSLMVFSVLVGMVCVGRLHALSPLCTPACSATHKQQQQQQQEKRKNSKGFNAFVAQT
jgi:uncharacterized metal-binding protein